MKIFRGQKFRQQREKCLEWKSTLSQNNLHFETLERKSHQYPLSAFLMVSKNFPYKLYKEVLDLKFLTREDSKGMLQHYLEAKLS